MNDKIGRDRRNRVLSMVIVLAMVLSAILPGLPAEATAAEGQDARAGAEYEIYPTPQKIVYGTAMMTLNEEVQLTVDGEIDQYTKDRLNETLEVLDISKTDASSGTRILMAIYTDAYGEKYGLDADLFDKSDAYALVIQEDEIAIIGKDTDAVFYGATTLKRIFEQVQNREVRTLRVEDYSDIKARGFIEGYYGNPWSVEDRVELMKFGGELKMNQYVFAPKDDPYHNAKWREMYPEKELEDIQRLAAAGNENKCYYVWTIHCFMNSAFRFNTDANYNEDFGVLKAKFTQLLEAGVRQFGVLADDAGSINPNNALRLLADLEIWLAEQQKTYTDLKTEIIYCPGNYMGNGSSEELRTMNQASRNIHLISTGGRIWGEVTKEFGQTFFNNIATEGNPGRYPYMWVNWPCTDNSKNHLIMGGQETFLRAGVDGSIYEGIILNPMQQSEPSKVAIFMNADFAWKCWDTEADGSQAWNDSFKYVERLSSGETPEAAALREMSKHMINQAMPEATVRKLEESVELKPKLDAFMEALLSGGSMEGSIAVLEQEFEVLRDAAELYLVSGNERMIQQISTFLNSMRDLSQANLYLLEAMKTLQEGVQPETWTYFSAAQSSYEQSKTYGFDYRGETKYAEVGNQHIIPFTEKLMKYVGDVVKAYIDPEHIKLEESVIFSVGGNDSTAGFDLSKVRDGNLNTDIEVKRNQQIGDYVGLTFNKSVYVENLQFDLWKEGSDKNLFYRGTVQYTLDGKAWIDLEDELQPSGTELRTVRVEQVNREIRGFRYVCTDLGGKDRWLAIREIQYNKSAISDEPEKEYYTGTVIRTADWEVVQGTVENNLTDGNDSTFVWYDPTTSVRDASLVGDYIGLDLGEVKKVGDVHIVLGGNKNDKWSAYDLQYSTDQVNWVTFGSYTGTSGAQDTLDVDLGGVDARYVRLVNKVQINKWLQFSEFSVGPYVFKEEGKPLDYTNLTESNLRAVYEDDFFKIVPAENVTLQPGEYIGLDLQRIRDLHKVSVEADAGEPKPEVSMNGIEWTALPDGNLPYARYVRLMNETKKAVSFDIDKFEVTSNEIKAPGFLESTMGINSSYVAEDARNNGAAGNWFDKNVATGGKFCDFPKAGQYITYDLGQDISLSSLRVTVANNDFDYPRDAVLEVSEDNENWTEVLTIGDGVSNSSTDKDTPAADNGWTFDTNMPNYAYQEARDLNVKGRYLRMRFTADYLARFVKVNEITINDGAYLPVSNDPTFEAAPYEVSGFEPQNLRDGDLFTAFKPNMEGRTDGYLIYRLSQDLNVKKINLVQNGNVISNARVTARVGNQGEESRWVELGIMSESLTSLFNPAYDYLYELKLEWDDVAPVIYEIALLNSESHLPDYKDEMQEQIASYQEDVYTTDSWKLFKPAYDAAKAVLGKEDAGGKEMYAAIQKLTEAAEKLERRGDLTALRKKISTLSGLKQSAYTSDSWKAMTDVLNRAKALETNAANCSQAAADKMVKELENAEAALKKVTDTPPTPVKVTKVTLKANTLDVAAGKKITVKVSIAPSNADVKSVKWITSNKKYATVSAKGVVTTKKAGSGKTVKITAIAQDGSGIKNSVKIRIRKNAVKKITLKPASKTVRAGKSLKIHATVAPSKQVNKKLAWSTSNKKFATVSSTGVVKAKKAGKGKIVKIKAVATDGSKKQASIKIRIK